MSKYAGLIDGFYNNLSTWDRSKTLFSRLSFILIISLFIPFLHAKDPLRFDFISAEQGLSQATAFTMIQDKKGYIWIGTQNGLNQFDGYEFNIYKSSNSDPNSLSDNFILTLFEDSAGLIWVGTRNGLNVFNRTSQQFTQYFHDKNDPDSLSNNYITSIVEDKTGYIWIGTAGGGINRFDQTTNQFVHINPLSDGEELIYNPIINQLLVDSKGLLWVGSGNARLLPSSENGGINTIDVKTLEVKRVLPLVNSEFVGSINSVNSIFEDDQKNIWFGTSNKGLLKKKPLINDFEQYFSDRLYEENKTNWITAINQDFEHNLWFSTQYSGLFKFDISQSQLNQYIPQDKNTSNMVSNEIVSILVDATGVLWFGTWTQGINRLDLNAHQFQRYLRTSTENHLAEQEVLAITSDQQGRVWLATWTNGLLEFDVDTGKTIAHQQFNSLSVGNIREVFVDRNNKLWIGSNTQGLFYYDADNGVVENFKHNPENEDSLSNNHVIQVIDDPLGNLWIATRGGGINYFDVKQKKFKRFSHLESDSKSLSNNKIGFLFYDEGLLWVGADGSGLDIFDPINEVVIKNYSSGLSTTAVYKNGLSSNVINNIFQDSKGRYWIGSDKGVTKVNWDATDLKKEHLTFELVSEYDEPKIGPVGGILEDKNGQLWVSSLSGVSKFDPETYQVKNYGESSGVLTQGYYIRARYQMPSGLIIFGAVNGLSIFSPEKIKDDVFSPQVILSQFMLFNNPLSKAEPENIHLLTKPIDETEQIVFNYKQNVFSLIFSGLHYADPDKNLYAYQLVGFDKDWNKTDAKNRRATYTNLDPGNYTFYLKASNKDGVWSEPKEMLKIKVKPAPWNSLLAYFLYCFILVSIITFIIRQAIKSEKLNREKEINKIEKDFAVKSSELKSKFLANMSHEIRTPMNAVIGLSNLALRLPMDQKLKDYLIKIESSSKSLLRIINDILDYSKIDADKLELERKPFLLEKVVKDVVNVISASAEQKNLELIVSHLEDIDFKLVGDELRLRQVIINLATNAIKFTKNGYVEIRFEKIFQTNEIIDLKISVIDTGIGLTPEQTKKIFVPFVQGDMSTTREYGGTGLGLSLSRHLVNLMDGKINISSQVNEGTIFSFNAKFGIVPHENSLYFYDKPLLSQLKVLVIEDNPETLVSLIRMLESFGIKAIPYLASTISPAQLQQSYLDFSQYNLIMVDSSLPTSDFFDIGYYIKGTLIGNNTHVLLMSGISTTIEPVHHKIFDTIIEKPITPSELHDGLLMSLNLRKPSVSDVKLSDDEKSCLLAQLASKRVLLVEDNLINQQVARELIGAFGVSVECANNGQEAIDILKKNRFDMVFMDMQMPVLDGIETTRIIRELSLLDKQPIVAMTAHAMVGDKEKCIAAGMDDYLSKPINPEKLYQCLQSWLLKDNKQALGTLSNLLKELTSSEFLKERSQLENEQIIDKLIQSVSLNNDRDTLDAVDTEQESIMMKTINYPAGLLAMDNNQELYHDVLTMFVDKYQHIKTIEILLAESDAKDLRRFFHTLKGLSASIGAEKLEHICLALEAQYSDEQHQNSQYKLSSFIDELNLVCLEINRRNS